MEMKGGVGAGGSGGDDQAWAIRAGERIVNGNGDGIGKTKAALPEPSLLRRLRHPRHVSASRIAALMRKHRKHALPRHSDNNIVPMALCKEAGWTVEADGTTYNKADSREEEVKTEKNADKEAKESTQGNADKDSA